MRFLILSSYLILMPVLAQAQVASPQAILCTQLENFGTITEKSLEHSHHVLMNFDVTHDTSDGQYAYLGMAKNHGDNGGGESVNAFYDASTGKLISSTSGISCPAQLQ